jgi:hypothetical protein
MKIILEIKSALPEIPGLQLSFSPENDIPDSLRDLSVGEKVYMNTVDRQDLFPGIESATVIVSDLKSVIDFKKLGDEKHVREIYLRIVRMSVFGDLKVDCLGTEEKIIVRRQMENFGWKNEESCSLNQLWFFGRDSSTDNGSEARRKSMIFGE